MKKAACGNAAILFFVSKVVNAVSEPDADTSVAAEEIIEEIIDYRMCEFHVQKENDIESTLDRTGAGADEQQQGESVDIFYVVLVIDLLY